MFYPTKTAIILRDDLQAWQKVNAAAFLSGGLVNAFPEMAGKRYADRDGNDYVSLIREPVFVYGSDANTIRRTYDRARSRGLSFAIYTRSLFATSNDSDNRAAVASKTSEALDLVGLGLHAERKIIDKIVNGLRFLA